MSSRRPSRVVTPGPTAPRGAARTPRRRPTTRGGALAAVLVAGLAGGLGTAATVDALAPRTPPAATSPADGGDALPPGGPRVGSPATASREPAGTSDHPGTGAPVGSGTAGATATSRDAADVGLPDRAATRAEELARGIPEDARPLPLPGLVPRDTVGPVWLSDADRADGLLALDVAESASGVLDVVPGASPAPAPAAAAVRTVRVEVERGLPVDGAAFAAMVMATLNDPRGWGAHGAVSFARADGPAELRVVLASPATVDAMCAPLRTDGEVSCGRNGHAALNFRRWVHATPEFPDRHLYRQYVVNHEVGHLLGHPHEQCPGAGRVAPVMQQQSYAVAPCTPNGWPFP